MSELYIDIVRVLHLIFLALGMGTAMYLDIRTLLRFRAPYTLHDLIEFSHAHNIVRIGLIGLWLTGAALVYIRTNGDLANFSPKLFVKLCVVAFLTINSAFIGKYVFQVLEESIGKAICSLSWKNKMPMLLIASNSAFCWFSGLLLGASVVLKPLGWDILMPLFIIMFITFIVLSSIIFIILSSKI